MEKKFALVDFRAENLIFTVNKTFTPSEEPLALDVKLNSQYHIGAENEDPTFLNVAIRVFDQATEKNYPFTIVADITGVFMIQGDNAEEREEMLKKEGLITLLPYARAMISQIASMANMPQPVILPPLDIKGFKQA